MLFNLKKKLAGTIATEASSYSSRHLGSVGICFFNICALQDELCAPTRSAVVSFGCEYLVLFLGEVGRK